MSVLETKAKLINMLKKTKHVSVHHSIVLKITATVKKCMKLMIDALRTDRSLPSGPLWSTPGP